MYVNVAKLINYLSTANNKIKNSVRFHQLAKYKPGDTHGHSIAEDILCNNSNLLLSPTPPIDTNIKLQYPTLYHTILIQVYSKILERYCNLSI